MPTSAARQFVLVPSTGRERPALALAGHPWGARASLVAVCVPEPHANALAMWFVDEDGAPVEVDVDAVAAWLSRGGGGLVCVARWDGQDGLWRDYEGGRPSLALGPEDDRFQPVDDEGFPRLEVSAVRRGEAPPDGWRRVRTCLDVGMAERFSCRFGPVLHAVSLVEAGGGGAQAWLLVREGQPLTPPAEVPWPAHRDRRRSG